MVERRKVQRGRTYLGGSLNFGHPGFSVECILRNMSPNGAKVVFSDAVPVPNEVGLYVPQYSRTQRARFVWRRGSEAGVVFPDAGSSARVVSLDEARRMRALRNET